MVYVPASKIFIEIISWPQTKKHCKLSPLFRHVCCGQLSDDDEQDTGYYCPTWIYNAHFIMDAACQYLGVISSDWKW